MWSCHGKTPTELLGPSKPFPQVLCLLQKVYSKEKTLLWAVPLWILTIWWVIHIKLHLPRNPAGTSPKSRNPASRIKWKFFPLLSDLQGSIQGIFSHLSVKHNVTAAQVRFFFAICQQHFFQSRRVTSILSGAAQDTCKSSSLFGNRDEAPSILISQEEQFQNVFTDNCNEKIGFYFCAPWLSVLLSCVSLLCHERHSPDRCSWG